MPALAEIRKKPQRKSKQLTKRKPDKPDLKNPKSLAGQGPPVELLRELTRLVKVEGMGYAKAYRRVFPHRQQALTTASTTGRLLVERYLREHKEDFREMRLLYNLGEDRLAKEMDERYEAKTLREVVKTELKKVKLKDGRTSYKVVTLRDTIEVEDNTTRMRITELHADVLGARKLSETGGNKQNVAIIYVMGGKIMKKRQERIVG